jgi:KaiC/GvpD/RAD55 family RecA-like ATPase
MERIPFGIDRLDTIINGGAPPGSVVLLAGEAGAGAREFLYTCSVMNGLAHADPDQFELLYGTLEVDSVLANDIHYLSFTASPGELERELKQVITPSIVDAAIDAITIEDLSAPYFQLSPVPRSWFVEQHQRLSELGGRSERRDTLEALGEYLDDNAAGNLVLIDSLSDLAALSGDHASWGDIAMLVKGLRRASWTWNGLILLLVDREAMTDTEFGLLMGSADGTFTFEWERGGNELARTMVVREFRGVLSEIEEEDIVRFETEIHEHGFDITDIRKIR